VNNPARKRWRLHKAFEISNKDLKDRRWDLIERIAYQPAPKSSARLCEFLFYTAECALRELRKKLPSNKSAHKNLPSPPGLQSSEDSIVRNARSFCCGQKLTLTRRGIRGWGGGGEAIIVNPKGTHLRSSQIKSEPVSRAAIGKGKVLTSPSVSAPNGNTAGGHFLLVLAYLLAANALCSGDLGHADHFANSSLENSGPLLLPPPPTSSLKDPPIVIFSNALFSGDYTNGMPRRSAAESAGMQRRQDNYVGELTRDRWLASV